MKSKTLKKQSLILLAIAVVFVIVGILQGGFQDTMNKAIRICMECIGIG